MPCATSPALPQSLITGVAGPGVAASRKAPPAPPVSAAGKPPRALLRSTPAALRSWLVPAELPAPRGPPCPALGVSPGRGSGVCRLPLLSSSRALGPQPRRRPPRQPCPRRKPARLCAAGPMSLSSCPSSPCAAVPPQAWPVRARCQPPRGGRRWLRGSWRGGVEPRAGCPARAAGPYPCRLPLAPSWPRARRGRRRPPRAVPGGWCAALAAPFLGLARLARPARGGARLRRAVRRSSPVAARSPCLSDAPPGRRGACCSGRAVPGDQPARRVAARCRGCLPAVGPRPVVLVVAVRARFGCGAARLETAPAAAVARALRNGTAR